MLKFDNTKDMPKGLTKNMISVQEVIDILLSIAEKLPEGRTLDNIPFGIRLSNGRPIIFHSKDHLILTLIGNSYAQFLNLDADISLVSTKGEFYKKFKQITEENAIMKNKLSKINLMSKNPTCICEGE